MLRRRVETVNGDRDKDKNRIKQLQDAVNRVRIVSTFDCLPYS